MDNLTERLLQLKRFQPLTEETVDEFLEEVEELTRTGDRRVVVPILLMADDELPLSGVVDQMLAMLETVAIEEYVDELLAVLPRFHLSSPASARNEVRKLLWSEADRAVLIAKAKDAGPDTKNALRTLLEEIQTSKLVPAVEEVKKTI